MRRELRLVIARNEMGRSKANESNLTIAAVAREAGVSTALIQNCHPDIAELIRQSQGRTSRTQGDAKQLELKAELEKTRELRLEIALLKTKVATLASITEVLLDENRTLKSRLGGPKVVGIPKRT